MNQTLRVGDRIRLMEMTGDPDPIAAGATGIVMGIRHYDDGDDLWHQVDVDWDHGRTLMLVLPSDQIEIICGDSESRGE